MADSNNAQNKEVKLEDLLRLKRAERPDDAFWNTFDRQLHQRMLQTLVKKDPWYIQLLRGVSGRIAQTTAVGAAAAFLAMMVVRPALIDSIEPTSAEVYATQSIQPTTSPPVEVSMSDLDATMTADYQIESISSGSVSSELGYTSEYALDTFEGSVYDSTAFATDTAIFAGSGLATGLVY